MFSRKYLTSLIWPLVAEQFLSMTIGACDTVMVASTGEAGVSGVSLIDQLGQLAILLFASFATGGAIVVSQFIGRKDGENACHSAKQLLNLCLIVGLLVIAVCLPLRKQILNLVFGGADEAVLENAFKYFFWILFSFPLLGIYNSCAALLRAMGNSKVSLFTSILMNVLNIAGNALLIYGFNLGVSGAGISTLVSRGIAAFIMVFILNQKKWPVHFEKLWKFEFDFFIVRKILKVAVPSAIENSMFHIGKTIVYSFMSGFGVAAVSANAISNTVANFANIPGNALGLASVSLVGQCIGAGEKEQAKLYGRKMLKITYAGMFFTCLIVFVSSPLLVGCFNLSQASHSLAVGILRTCMIATAVIWPLSFVMPNILRGAGDARYTMIVSNISMWLFRIFFSYLISSYLLKRFPDNKEIALYGVWFGMYIDWLFRALFFTLRFRGKRWLEKIVI